MINFSTHDLVDELVKREGVDHCVVQPHHPYEVAVIKDLEALERKDYQAAYAQDKPMHLTSEGPCIIIVVND